jgi:hypothetical protein
MKGQNRLQFYGCITRDTTVGKDMLHKIRYLDRFPAFYEEK